DLFLTVRRPPQPTLFPYTTLFRSVKTGLPAADAGKVAELMCEADLTGADAHGIFRLPQYVKRLGAGGIKARPNITVERTAAATRSEEHTSELQSRSDLVCRLLLEK